MYHDFTWRVGPPPACCAGYVAIIHLPEPGMRPVFRLLSTIIPVVALAACAVPTAPEASQTCLAGKVPNMKCANGDFVNPLGDFVNPLGDDTTKTGP